MIHCILVDDEAASRRVLRELLQRFCPEVEVVAEADNVDDAEKKILNHNPELIFLDIQMPGKNGFELLKRFPQPNFSAIFITSYDQFAIKAFKFNALDYLLKPIDIEELILAVSRYNTNRKIYSSLLANVSRFSKANPRLAIHSKDRVQWVFLSEVVYFEASANYSVLHLISGESLVQPRTLGEMDTLLEDHLEFLRINKHLIINANFIKSYTKGDTCSVEMHSGVVFEISRRRKTDMLGRLSAFQLRHDSF